MGLDRFSNSREHVLTGDMNVSFIGPRLERYAAAVHRVSNALPYCITFIDGNVLVIARPKGHLAQCVIYNGHKRKHIPEYHAVNMPSGIIMHLHGSIEGRRDRRWTL